MSTETFKSKIIEADNSLDAVEELAHARGWTDGLPIIPPTEDRVSQAVKASGLPGDRVVAELPPRDGLATVEKIAINCVMAGCRPEYMPVLIAAVEAMAAPEFNLHGIQATTNPVGPMVIVNGPIRKTLGMNGGRNCLGPGNRANASIGRAVRLILLNVGGGVPDTVDKAVQGYPGKYIACTPENEEDSPWEPLHVERGFKKEDSAVTVVGAQGTTNCVTAVLTDINHMLLFMADAMSYMSSNNVIIARGEPLMLLTTGHAKLCAEKGMSKADVKRILWETAGFPIAKMPPVMRRERIKRLEHNGLIKPCGKPEEIMIVVAGGPEPFHCTFIPTFGDTVAVTKRISVPA